MNKKEIMQARIKANKKVIDILTVGYMQTKSIDRLIELSKEYKRQGKHMPIVFQVLLAAG